MNLWWTYQQLRSSNLKTRLAVIAKLAEFKHSDSVEPLLFALKDKGPEIRSAAALALGQFEDNRIAEPLIKMLNDPSPLTRATVAEVLGQRKEQSATRWLVSLLRDPDVTVQARVVRSLKRLGWQPQTEAEQKWHFMATGNLSRVAELGPEGIAPLVDLMRNGTPDQQLSAVKALGEVDDPRILKLALEALKKPNIMVRLAALDILKRIADPSAYEPVERLLTDKEVNMRVAAIATAASCGGERAVPKLVRMLKDPSWEVRREAVKALGKIGDGSAVDGLCTALHDSDHDVRETTAFALGKIGDPRAIRALVLTLLDEESFVRSAAYNSLMDIDQQWEKTEAARSALPQIKTALNYRGYWISQSVAKLVNQSEEEAPAAESQKPVARVETPAVTKAPAGLPPAAFAILSDLLADHDRDLRLAAAEAFGHLREKNAIAILSTALQDQDPFVSKAAEQALAALN
ncbi:MAG: HEAT repeat domain-containing protein [Limisphaerales bacterium]